MPLVRSEQCCSTEQQPRGVYQSYWKWTENTLQISGMPQLFEQGKRIVWTRSVFQTGRHNAAFSWHSIKEAGCSFHRTGAGLGSERRGGRGRRTMMVMKSWLESYCHLVSVQTNQQAQPTVVIMHTKIGVIISPSGAIIIFCTYSV